MGPLGGAVGDARFTFVVGKGGTGKTTAAGALALGLADAGVATHLLSTDPAHSVGDLFAQQLGGEPASCMCAPRLLLEEHDADAHARRWLDRVAPLAAELVEHGTLLDAADVAGFTRLAVPGVDEVMGMLRLVELGAGSARVVVDTAPTGHTLRLLDTAATHEGVAHALRAMADKAGTVMSSFAGRTVRLRGELLIDELDDAVRGFRALLADAAFVVATCDEPVVRAETVRLVHALRQRRLRVAATVFVGTAGETAGVGNSAVRPTGAADAGACFEVPLLPGVHGCDGLRHWLRAVQPCAARAIGGRRPAPGHPPKGRPVLPWLEALDVQLLLFAGKGGVGKSTCAAAVAVALADSRNVLLCSTDPAGSLEDVLGGGTLAAGSAGPRLRVVQVDAAAEAARLGAEWRGHVTEAMERIGLSEAATLDRRVTERLSDMAPPGIDEFAALAALLDAASPAETVVLDPPPTGHFLRLLTMPQVALDWSRQLMRILVKYHAGGVAGGVAEALLRTARELRALQERLRDPSRAGVVVVTTPEPMVQAETGRLIGRLREAAVPVAAVLLNRAEVPDTEHAARHARDVPLLTAPQVAAPAGSAAALREFMLEWRVAT
jgi:arsenite/tail-anchored protein-transporting ATPase